MSIKRNKPIRVVLAKIGLDGHDRGIKVVARALRDAGMEVIYLGMRVPPENVAQVALDEDADVIGISILSGAHLRLITKLVNALKKQRLLGQVILIVGGTIPENDVQVLKGLHVDGVFPTGTLTETLVGFIRDRLSPR